MKATCGRARRWPTSSEFCECLQLSASGALLWRTDNPVRLRLSVAMKTASGVHSRVDGQDCPSSTVPLVDGLDSPLRPRSRAALLTHGPNPPPPSPFALRSLCPSEARQILRRSAPQDKLRRMSRPVKLTPMLEQYFEIKRQVPDAILFYRLGDFYEMFYEDAERAAPILDLVLTARNKGQEHESPMCGVPYHAADGYIAKLIKHGFRVAICDQVDDAAAAKGLVRREIIRIVTPGTATESHIVDRESCYLLSLVASGETPGESNGKTLGAAYLDVSTGDFFVTSYRGFDDPRLTDDMARFVPREAIHSKDAEMRLEIPATAVEPSLFEPVGAHEFLSRHFGTQSLRGFGLEGDDPRIGAAGGAPRHAAAGPPHPPPHPPSPRGGNNGEDLPPPPAPPGDPGGPHPRP